MLPIRKNKASAITVENIDVISENFFLNARKTKVENVSPNSITRKSRAFEREYSRDAGASEREQKYSIDICSIIATANDAAAKMPDIIKTVFLLSLSINNLSFKNDCRIG